MTIRNSLIAGSLLLLTTSGAAFAQTVVLQPQDEVVVREYIVKQAPPAVALPDDYDVVIGEPLPETVTVTPLDAPGLSTRYEYVVVDGETLIVEPETRRVVQVLR